VFPRPDSGDEHPGNDAREVVGGADAVADIVAASAVRPSRVPLLMAGNERDDLRAALRPAHGAARDHGREPHLVEVGHWDRPYGAGSNVA
jgi:hypothetical protein